MTTAVAKPAVRERVRSLHQEHPDWLWQQIATEVEVSRERVRQIMAGDGVVSIRRPTHPAYWDKYRCPICGGLKSTAKAKTCRDCYPPAMVVDLTCCVCKIQFERSLTYHKVWKRQGGKLLFCGNRCQGKYVGVHYGFIAHPENKGHNSRKTHCLRGHAFSEENTYVYGNRRQCKACHRLRSKQQYKAKRAAAQSGLQVTP